MKILHTADWHIGKVLHKEPLEPELRRFMDWLIGTIEDEDVDLLLVSGDIFDAANPTIRDKEFYYECILRLYNTGCKVIITGGNHDSVGELNAPKEILSTINISVIGGLPSDMNDELIPVYDSQMQLQVLVAATPFLRDRDLRNKSTEENKYANRAEALREGIKNHYQKLGELCEDRNFNVPIIAMGHLYAQGASASDSERDIHIGNQAAVASTIFPPVFNYVALGHIHRPQMVDLNPSIRYSGSPIPLSFSEKEDEKIVVMLEIVENKIVNINELSIPKNRELIKFSGSYDEVVVALEKYKPEFDFPSFVEIEVIEEEFSAIVLSQVEELSQQNDMNEKFKILKNKTIFKNQLMDTRSLFTEGVSIEELKPIEVFNKRLESEEMTDETKELLQGAFLELLDSL